MKIFLLISIYTISIFLYTIIHECGHLIALLISKIKIVSFRILFISFDNKFKISKKKISSLGQVKYKINVKNNNEYKKLDKKIIFFQLSGLLFSIIVSIIFLFIVNIIFIDNKFIKLIFYCVVFILILMDLITSSDLRYIKEFLNDKTEIIKLVTIYLSIIDDPNHTKNETYFVKDKMINIAENLKYDTYKLNNIYHLIYISNLLDLVINREILDIPDNIKIFLSEILSINDFKSLSNSQKEHFEYLYIKYLTYLLYKNNNREKVNIKLEEFNKLIEKFSTDKTIKYDRLRLQKNLNS